MPSISLQLSGILDKISHSNTLMLTRIKDRRCNKTVSDFLSKYISFSRIQTGATSPLSYGSALKWNLHVLPFPASLCCSILFRRKDKCTFINWLKWYMSQNIKWMDVLLISVVSTILELSVVGRYRLFLKCYCNCRYRY